MLHLRIRTGLALGAAVILTVTACAKTIDGRASAAGNGALPTDQLLTAQGPIALPTDLSDILPTDFPTDLSDILPTDFGDITAGLPSGLSIGSLPDGWPDAIQLPSDATISFGESNEDGMTVIFGSATPAADLASQLDTEIEGAGYTQTDDTNFGGIYAYTYTQASTTVTLGIAGYGGQTIVTIAITSS